MEHIIEIAEYLGSFIVLIVVMVKTIKKELTEHTGITDEFRKKMPERAALTASIVDEMAICAANLDCDYVNVYAYHNGVQYADGNEAIRMSCVYEYNKPNVPSVLERCTNLNLAFCPHFNNEILNNGQWTCPDIEDIKDTMTASYNISKSMKIEAVIAYAIRNKRNQVVGFACACWCDKKEFKNDIHEVMKIASYIEANVVNK